MGLDVSFQQMAGLRHGKTLTQGECGWGGVVGVAVRPALELMGRREGKTDAAELQKRVRSQELRPARTLVREP